MRSNRRMLLLLVALHVLFIILVSTLFLFRGRLQPATKPFVGNALALESIQIFQSSLNKSLIFPALGVIELRQLRLDRIMEKDCSTMQKNPSPEYKAVPEAFRPSVTHTERLVMLLTLQVFIKTMEEHGLTYFLYGGTLLGAFRHHGFIPWDDDIDVLVRSSDKDRLCPILSNVPGYNVFCPEYFPWKFSRNGLKKVRGFRHSWPYISVSVFSENSTHIEDDLSRAHRVYDKELIFPLRRLLFKGAWLPVPHDSKAVLEGLFHMDLCQPLSYCHKDETRILGRSAIPCVKLYSVFPFVNTSEVSRGMAPESLRAMNRTTYPVQVSTKTTIPDAASTTVTGAGDTSSSPTSDTFPASTKPPAQLSLVQEIVEILHSGLNKSLIFPRLNSLDSFDIRLNHLGEKNCAETQKNASGTYSAVPQAFRPTMTHTERFVMLLTLQVFIKTMEEHGLTYFLYGGTLLGAFRHHGFIPWDDDIDVLVRSSDKDRLCPILSNVPGYTAYCPDHFQWKFFRQGLATLPWKRFRWPNVDIFFFSEDSERVVEELSGRRIYRKSDVFPLRYQPFEGAMLPAPQNIRAILTKYYDPDSCKPVTYCHKAERSVSAPPAIPCSQLHGFHPFVHRSTAKNGWVRETLMQGDKVLHTEDLPKISGSDPGNATHPATTPMSTAATTGRGDKAGSEKKATTLRQQHATATAVPAVTRMTVLATTTKTTTLAEATTRSGGNTSPRSFWDAAKSRLGIA